MIVGARGTNYLGIPTKILGQMLEDKDQARLKSADESRFESTLGISGMSEADKQRARMLRHFPEIAKVMGETEQRSEIERRMREKMRFDTEERAAKVKAKADEDAAEQAAGNAEMKARADWTRENTRTEILPHKFTGGLRGAKPVTQGAKLPIPGFGGMGGGSVSVPGFDQVQVAPTIPQDMAKWLQEHDPDNPALNALKEQEFQTRRNEMRMTVEKGRAKQQVVEGKAEKDRLAQEDSRRRQESARSFLNTKGFQATDEELARFDYATQGGKSTTDYFKVADQIRKDRATAQGKTETKEAKQTTSADKLRDEIAKLKKENLATGKSDHETGEATKKLGAEAIKINEETIKRKEAKLKEMEGGAAKPDSAPAKVPPAMLEALKAEMNDPSTPPEDKAKIKAILDAQGVAVRTEAIQDDQAMGDLRLSGMHPEPAPKPNAESGPVSDNNLRGRQRMLYAELAHFNRKGEDAPREIIEELNRIDETLKRRGFESFHAKGIRR